MSMRFFIYLRRLQMNECDPPEWCIQACKQYAERRNTYATT